MKSLTIRVDDATRRAARARAAEQGTSVSAVLQQAVEQYAWSGKRAREVMRQLVASAEQAQVRTAGQNWTCDELRER